MSFFGNMRKSAQNVLRVTLFLTASAFIFSPHFSYADEYHYINEIIGEKAGGMGGAFTAIADDPSGAYYNPAGLAFAYDNQISLSVNTIRFQQYNYEEVLSGKDFLVNYQSFFPSYFGIIQSVGKGKMGFSIAITNADVSEQFTYIPDVLVTNRDQAIQYDKNISITVDINDSTYLFGPSYAVLLSDSLSFGATIYGLYRKRKYIRNQTSTYVRVGGQDFSSYVDQVFFDIAYTNNTDNILGLVGIIGLQYMPTKKISLGLKFEGGTILSHKMERHISEKWNTSYGGANNALYLADVESSKNKDTYPHNFRAGIAYFVSKALLLSFDVIVYLPQKVTKLRVEFEDRSENGAIDDQGTEDITDDVINGNFTEDGSVAYSTSVYTVKYNAVVNAAFGLEYYITPNLPLRWGAFTNMANTNKYSSETAGPDHVDYYGTTLGIAWQTASSSIALSGAVQYGFGQGNPVEGTTQAVDIKSLAYSFSLTGSSRY